MNLLSVNNLSKSFADRTLFTDVSFGLDKGQKMGLIAENGAGKSTLFKILTNKEIQDEGTFAYRDGVVRGMLDQEPHFDKGTTIKQYIYSNNPRLQLLTKYQEFIDKGDMESEAFLNISDEIDANNAWEEENKITEVLGNLNFTDFEVNTDMMSGGEKRRLSLAKCLIDEPAILFLDEPTNHLDFKMVEWLEKFLADSTMAILLVTHDRYFLDNVCGVILELSPTGVFTHKGDYEFFLTSKAEREANLNVQIGKAKNLYKKELDWLRKQPKARGTKSKSRIEAAGEIEKKSKQKVATHELDIETGMQRLGKKIIEVKHLNKSYGERKIVNDFNYFFKGGEKIGIVGDNGAGKTTLLNLLIGLDPEHTGTVSRGETVSIGYYSQKGINVKPGLKVIEVVKNIAEVIEMKDGSRITASQMLNQFNFSPKKQYDFVDKLSGGERKRLYLVTILINAPNFLILDEPTNDLDLLTLSVLENYLMNFKGCVIIVSHDRYFLDRIVDSLFVFGEGGNIRNFPGNYTQLRAVQKVEAQTLSHKQSKNKAPLQKANETPKSDKPSPSKMSFGEKREFESLEKEIADFEERKSQIESDLSSNGTNSEKINELSIELASLLSDLESKTNRWMELAEKA
ncbi:MAG: ATP-binding cassette subfamily F protein uup [Saprospiraceae bacterium]